MTTNLNALLAGEHVADLRRAASHDRATYDRFAKRTRTRAPKTVALRQAGPGDARTLSVLAELDEEPALAAGDTLLAVIDGDPVAALSLKDGRVVANPFVATSDAVKLLKLRARHLADGRVRQPRRRWLPRFA